MFPGFALSHISYANPLHLICSLEMVEKTWNFLEKKNTSNIQSPFRQFFTPKLPLLSFFCPAQVGLSLSTYPKFTHMTAVFKCIRAVPGSVLGSILRDAVPGELLAWSCLLVKQKSVLGSRMGTLLETPSVLELDPLGKIKRQKVSCCCSHHPMLNFSTSVSGCYHLSQGIERRIDEAFVEWEFPGWV